MRFVQVCFGPRQPSRSGREGNTEATSLGMRDLDAQSIYAPTETLSVRRALVAVTTWSCISTEPC